MKPSAYHMGKFANTLHAKLLQINKQFVLTPGIYVKFARIWEDSQLWLARLCREVAKDALED